MIGEGPIKCWAYWKLTGNRTLIWPGTWNMGGQLGELNNLVRDNLPIASIGQGQNIFIQLSKYKKIFL